MDFFVEQAKSGRAKCSITKKAIAEGEVKLIMQEVNKWTGKPISKSVCKEAAIPLIQKEIDKLQLMLAELQQTQVNYQETRQTEIQTGKRIQI